MLQEKTYTYGSTKSAGSRYYRTELTLKEKSVSGEENTSLIEYTLTLYSGIRRVSQWRTGAKIWLGGVLYAHRDGTDYGSQITIGENDSLTLMQGTFSVPHGEDGTAKLSVEFSVYHPKTETYTPGNFTYTGGEITLTPIERATTLGVTDGYIGSTAVVALSRKKSSYTHSVSYAFGESTGYLHADGSLGAEERFSATAVAFPIPEAFYYQIPRAKEGVCTLTCHTYDGETPIGTPQTACFTVMTREADCAPVLCAAVEDVNPQTLALTGDKTVLVRYISDAKCTLTATARLGAEITGTTLNGQETENTHTLSGAEGDSFVFRAEDSRGYTAAVTVQTGLVPYFRPTANVTAARVDPTSGRVQLRVRGIYFGGSFGAAENFLRVFCQLPNGERAELTPVLSGGSYTAEGVVEGFDYTKSHLISVTAEDALASAAATASVQKGVPVFNWNEHSFHTNVPTCLCGVYVQKAAVSGPLRVQMGESLLISGGGVLGTVYLSAGSPTWQGTPGVSAAYGENGVVITLPEGISGVMALSPEPFTLL